MKVGNIKVELDTSSIEKIAAEWSAALEALRTDRDHLVILTQWMQATGDYSLDDIVCAVEKPHKYTHELWLAIDALEAEAQR